MTENYRVLLFVENVGSNKAVVFHALTSLMGKTGWRNVRAFMEACVQCELTGEILCDWRVVSPKRLDVMRARLREVGAKLIFYPYPLETMFPHDQLAEPYNRLYSADLQALEETRLTDWAQEHQVSEVYRLSVFPSFSQPYLFRIWKNTESRMVKVLGAGMGGYEPEYRADTEEWLLTDDEWRRVLEAINPDPFWANGAWDIKGDDRSMRDGTGYIFEGYKDGQYKAIRDRNFEDDRHLPTLDRFLRGFKPVNLEF
jgi:hypothetical protein